MKKTFLTVFILLLLAFSLIGCTKAPSSANAGDTPSYTMEQVLEKAKARAAIGQDSHIEWTWDLQYLPAEPGSKLKAVWKVTQTGSDMDTNVITQTTYFHEDTGTFTYVR